MINGRYGAVQLLGEGSYPRPDVLSVSYGAPECSFECEQYYCSMSELFIRQLSRKEKGPT
jgi:hypothetical protein